MNRPTTSSEEKPRPTQDIEVSAMDSSVDAKDCTEAEILAVIQAKNLWLRFPSHLEARYLELHMPHAIPSALASQCVHHRKVLV